MKTQTLPETPRKTRLDPARLPGTSRKTTAGMQTPGSSFAVTLRGSAYLVDFGSGVMERFHTVSKHKDCSCGNSNCEAIDVVRGYLQNGGTRAPDLEGLPSCPICGCSTTRDRVWDGKYSRELGWRCTKGGLAHFLDAKAERIRKRLAEDPWLFPPAPGYPGIRRDELMTWEESRVIRRQKLLENGYDPTA